MDAQSLIVGGALLIVGFFIGRMTAPKRDGHTIVYPPRPRDRDRTEQDADKDPEIISLIKEGRMIDAIKRHRDLTGSGLKEAKDAIDALAERVAR
jgi:hypothetical protein